MARRRDSDRRPQPDLREYHRTAARYCARLHGLVTAGEAEVISDAELRELAEDVPEAQSVLSCLDRADEADRERSDHERKIY